MLWAGQRVHPEPQPVLDPFDDPFEEFCNEVLPSGYERVHELGSGAFGEVNKPLVASTKPL